MNGLTNYITERPWLDTITAWYVHVDDAYVRLMVRRGYPLRTSGPEPTFSDSEVITVSLIIETFFQGHEEVGYTFVAQYLRDLFPQLLDLDRFNPRRRDLIAVIEALRRDLRDQKLDRTDPLRLVDQRARRPDDLHARGPLSQCRRQRVFRRGDQQERQDLRPALAHHDNRRATYRQVVVGAGVVS